MDKKKMEEDTCKVYLKQYKEYSYGFLDYYKV